MRTFIKHAEELDQKYLAENQEYHQMEDIGDILINLLRNSSLINFTYDHYYRINSNGDFEFHLDVGTSPEDHADNPERNAKELTQKELATKIIDFGMKVKKKFPSREFDMKSHKESRFNGAYKEIIFTILKSEWNK